MTTPADSSTVRSWRHLAQRARLALLALVLANAACAQQWSAGPDTLRGGLPEAAATSAAAAADVLHWNQPAVRANCPDQPGYLWVQAAEGPACIRYFASANLAGARIAVVQFSGDRDDVMDLPPTEIAGNTVRLRMQDAQRSSDRAGGVPWVFMARPGTYGSSGNHRARRQAVEFHALNAALDALVRRERLQRIVLLGHSGGATAGAALLTLGRTDVACAVLTSGAFSLLERARLLRQSHGGRTDTTGSASFYDPQDHVDGIARDPARRIVLIGSREDKNTPFYLQERFADSLYRAGHEVEMQSHDAEPPLFHDLKDRIGPRTAGQCAQDAMAEAGGR